MSSVVLAGGVLAVFLSLLVIFAVIGGLTEERQAVGRSLGAIRALDSSRSRSAVVADPTFGERVVRPVLAALTRLGRRALLLGEGARVARALERAGSPASWDAERVQALKVLGFGAGAGLGLALALVAGSGIPGTVLAVAIGAAAGLFAPDLALYQVGYNRRERLQRDLPDAVDLLTISVEAGLAFDAALMQVARNTVGPLAEEFFRVLQEMQIGLARGTALQAMADRVDLPDLRTFVSAMLQADRFGIPTANVLRVQTREMRVRRSQRAEEAAQKVPVKIILPLIFCILPALFVVVIGPAVINIIRTF